MKKTIKPINELLDFAIINVDKPAGITSFKTADKVRKILGVKKTGHFGTLDPAVTGVLPVAINRACKLSDYFMKKDKEYEGEMYVHNKIDKVTLENEMNKFVGEIVQKPPKKSRVKRVERVRIVNKFKIIDIKDDKDKKGIIVKFTSSVQAGTYIRKLISDLGEKIGGAHMTKLRRTKAGLFEEKNSFTLDEIIEAYKSYKEGNEEKLRKILIPASIVKRIITSVQVNEDSVKSLLNGKPLENKDIKSKTKIPNSEKLSVFYLDKFIGIYYKATDEQKEKNPNIIAKPEFVYN